MYLMIKCDSLESLTTYLVMWFRSQFVQLNMSANLLLNREETAMVLLFNTIFCNKIQRQ